MRHEITASDAMLQIYLFGRPRLLLDDRPVSLPGRPKVLPLVGHVLLRARTPVSRDLIARTLWPDDDDADARANLRRHLHYISAALPPCAAGKAWVVTTPRTLTWNAASDVWCDVVEFERYERVSDREAEAVALYTGELLEGYDEEWLDVDRELYRSRYLGALERLIATLRGRRRYDEAEVYAHTLLGQDPWRETAARALMSIRAEAGDRAGALAAFERFAERLRRDLDTEPMPETQAAYAMLRAGGIAIDHAPRAPERSPAPPAARTGGELPFVGRSREIETIRERGVAAANGAGGTVTIGGEAGVGKSRLVREAGLQFEATGGSIFAGTTSARETMPYQAIVEALRAAVPLAGYLAIDKIWLAALAPLSPDLPQYVEVGEAPRVELNRERTRLFEACAVFFGALAARRPIALVLEDLHWAGSATIALVEYLARRLRHERVLMLTTYREDELERAHPLRDMRRSLERDRVLTHVALGRLSRADVALLVERVNTAAEADPVVERLHHTSDGNPFFLGEVMRDALETGDLRIAGGAWQWSAPRAAAPPLPVRRLLAGRVARLSRHARALADVAAVAGAFDIELLVETLGWAEANVSVALDELVDRRLMLERADGGRYDYAFAHQLVAATIYAELDTAELRRRHRRVASVMDGLCANGRGELVAEIARHWDCAGDFERAAGAYVRAAERAFGVAAYDEGERLVTRALELSAEPRLRFEALLHSEAAASVHGDRALQTTRLPALEALVEMLDDDDARLEVAVRRIALANLRNDRENESAMIAQLLKAAESRGDLAWEAAAREAETRMCRTSGDYDRARAAFERLVSIAEQTGDRGRYVKAYIARADTDIYQGRFDAARASLDALRELVDASSDRAALVRALMTFARSALARQDYDEMTVHAREAYRISRELGDREGEALALHTIANGLVYPFRVAEARSTYRAAGEIYDAIDHKVGQASLSVDEGLFFTELGQLDAGIERFRHAETVAAAIGFTWVRCVTRINHAYALRLRGDAGASAAIAREALAYSRELGSAPLESAALGTLGAAECALGDLNGAIGHLRAGVELRRPAGRTPRLGDNLCALANALLLAGDIDAAAAASTELLSLHAGNPHLAPQPVYWLWVAAQVARASGHPEQAAELLRAAGAAREARLALIDDEATRRSFAALPFNCAVAEALAPRGVLRTPGETAFPPPV